MDNIIKRDGRVVDFRPEKITMAIYQAAIAVGGRDKQTAEQITGEVVAILKRREEQNSFPTVEEVQDLVEKCLIERGHAKTAKAYIIYRYEHALKRAGRPSLAYSRDNIPYQKLWQLLSWAVDHECYSLAKINSFNTPIKFQQLVAKSEEFYAAEINNAANSILAKIKDIRLVIVSGPSASGKTTTTLKIKEILAREGFRFRTLNVDNYFFDLSEHPKDMHGDFDYETPQAIELALINRHIKEMLEGKSVDVPCYNFKKGMRDGISETLCLGQNEILLIDSLHGMFPQMTEGIAEAAKFKIYIETLAQVKNAKQRFIRWADIRMLRRMVRDSQFRNADLRETILHWHYVRRSELRYIVPMLHAADCVINSFMVYELPLFKRRLKEVIPALEKQLAADPHAEDAYERAARVSELFAEITDFTALADSDYEDLVPRDSLLREFLGGSIYPY